MSRDIRISIRVAGGLGLAVVLDTVQQLVWKKGMIAIPESASRSDTIEAVLHEPLLAAVAVLMVARLVNWLKILELVDLSYAQPITSLSYVSVTALSALYLKETMAPLQIAGMAIIVGGVWCISQTGGAARPSQAPSS